MTLDVEQLNQDQRKRMDLVDMTMTRWRDEANYAHLLGSELYEKMVARIRPDSTVLDIGCGNGSALAFFNTLVPQGKSIGIDLATWVTQYAHNRRGKKAHTPSFLTGDVQALPLASNSVDVAFSVYVLPYLPDKLQAIREVYRVLKPNGIGAFIVGTTPLLHPSTLLPETNSESDVSMPRVRDEIYGTRPIIVLEKQGKGLSFDHKFREPPILNRYTVEHAHMPFIESYYLVKPKGLLGALEQRVDEWRERAALSEDNECGNNYE